MSLNYIKYLLSEIFLSLKDNLALKATVSCWLFFSGIHVYLYAVGALLVFDVITGIYASMLKGKKFTSRHLKKGLLEKLALYLILMLASFVMEAVLKSIFGWESYFVVFLVTILITTYECVSICENILQINPKLTYLKSLIGLSNRMRDATIKYAEDKVESVKVNISTEIKIEVEKPIEKKEEDI
ncbi:MAG: phage holin family protein [Bacteroidia bacterium]|nr:phage holin family protein [Bacteroidia bacterium]